MTGRACGREAGGGLRDGEAESRPLSLPSLKLFSSPMPIASTMPRKPRRSTMGVEGERRRSIGEGERAENGGSALRGALAPFAQPAVDDMRERPVPFV